ncbi:hypothetical protein OG749_34410 [Streptomyces nojiriensis]|uniref:hypothetical protein n=1 Tax=Streptomyces nojiriensis TaxID=66374 RepID=UPI002E170102
MKSRIRRRGIVAAAAALGLAAVGVSLTTSAASGEPITVAQPPSAVEDGAYPNADQILAQRGITLTKGDGGIILADCAQAGSFQVKVLAVTTPDDDEDQICFAAPGATGFLAFTIPDAYRIFTYGRSVKASLSTNEQPAETVEVAKDSTKGIGESIDPNARAVLLELRITG